MTDDTLPFPELDDTAAIAPPAADLARSEPDAPAARPRTRWAAVVWGLVFAALAAVGMWLTSEPARLDDLAAWVLALDAGSAVGYGLLAFGGLVLIIGLVGILRRAQLVITR